jgi:hypothetical protein
MSRPPDQRGTAICPRSRQVLYYSSLGFYGETGGMSNIKPEEFLGKGLKKPKFY